MVSGEMNSFCNTEYSFKVILQIVIQNNKYIHQAE